MSGSGGIAVIVSSPAGITASPTLTRKNRSSLAMPWPHCTHVAISIDPLADGVGAEIQINRVLVVDAVGAATRATDESDAIIDAGFAVELVLKRATRPRAALSVAAIGVLNVGGAVEI